MFDIQEELKKLPAKPGVYIMHDDRDAIIYVGKAISLKNRVRQYFQTSRNKGAKIEQMVTRIARFEYIVTDSELEALVLECNLIKEHRPKYNTMLKDDKTYPFIKVTTSEAYPRILFSRSMKKDKNKYYGPYTSAGAVKDTIELIRKIYKVRTCNRRLPQDIGKERPCLNYHIKQCDAPCQGYISQEEYRRSLNGAMDFLNGNYGPILKMLEKRMLDASERMEYEEAATWRDLKNSVSQIAQKQKITSSDGEDKDVIAVKMDGSDAVAQVFFIRQGRLIGRDHFFLRIAPHDSQNIVISSFMKQFYSGTPFIPREIMIPCEIEDQSVLEEWLGKRKGQKVHIKVPKKGTREKLVELATQNAEIVLRQDKDRIKREEGRTIGAMKEIAGWLDLPDLVRVEAYDISNISGFESVGSMAVFERGKPKRSDYRKFRIKTVQGPNDYASMEEVLTRRFTHESDPEKKEYDSFGKLPDLIMMDGGRGQVSAAKEALAGTALADVPLYGMVKDDHHRTRAIVDDEGGEIAINRNRNIFTFVTNIQDETHRYANDYRKRAMKKRSYAATLTALPGVGEKTSAALLAHFKTVAAVRQASISDLEEVKGISHAKAEMLYNALRNGI